jgi:glucose-1-phosphate thymidylyltransferase
MRELAQPMIKNQYGQYPLQVVGEIRATGKANLD